jgi:hypothetical protein
VFARLSPAIPSVAYDTYWRFAAERQRVYFRRLSSNPPPWTDDQILQEFRFTNVYRASDRVTQYLIRHVIYGSHYDRHGSPEEVVFRVILFKLFNRVSTWRLFEHAYEAVTLKSYNFDRFDQILTRALGAGARLYSAAYIMPMAGRRYSRKHRTHLRLLEYMLADGLPLRLTRARSMQEAFLALRSYPSIGDFLGCQFITDLNYSELMDFSESEFVVPGPGAKDGIAKCFTATGGLNGAEVIRLMMDRQEEEFERLGIVFPSLWGRRLQLIDCQNLFCEVAKYTRVSHPSLPGISGRKRIKQRFRPVPDPVPAWFPPKWGINCQIGSQP